MARPLVGISSCLLGNCVRYDGGCRHEPAIIQGLGKHAELVGFCPEHESGMPVPREPMDLYDISGEIKLRTVETGRDLTPVIHRWIEEYLLKIHSNHIKGFILKSGSPSCGICSARIHRGGKLFRNGTGIFAEALRRKYPDLPVAQDTELDTPEKIAFFSERIER